MTDQPGHPADPIEPSATDDTAGRPIGRRIALGTIAAGVAGLFVAPTLQEKWSDLLGAASQRDPTGLSGLLPEPRRLPATSASPARSRRRTLRHTSSRSTAWSPSPRRTHSRS